MQQSFNLSPLLVISFINDKVITMNSERKKQKKILISNEKIFIQRINRQKIIISPQFEWDFVNLFCKNFMLNSTSLNSLH